jgi:hypothetical protein
MARLTQICASHNDLFGLDDRGRVFQYNFNTKAWVKLAARPRQDGVVVARSEEENSKY